MKSLRLILALYALFWFNMFVPGHTRGRVTLPEDSVSRLAKDGCCSQPASQKGDQPTKDQQRRCAVCFFAAFQDLPPTFQIDLRPGGREIDRLHTLGSLVQSVPSLLVLYSTGPPAHTA